MTNQLPPELFAQPPVRSDFAQKRTYRLRRLVTSLIILLAVAAGLFWKFEVSPPHELEEIPTIKAEGPLKQKPDQPGGIDIPHQDVLAYQQIDGGDTAKPETEHLLPPPETPQSVPGGLPPAPSNPAQASVVAPPPVMPQAPVMKIENLIAPATPIPTTVLAQNAPPAPTLTPPAIAMPSPIARAEMSKKTTSSGMTAAPISGVQNTDEPSSMAPALRAAPTPSTLQVQSVVQPTVTPSEVSTTASEKLASASSLAKAPQVDAQGKPGFRVQLASFPDKETAQTAMKNLQKKYESTLGTAHLTLVKADLGARGIYYRIQSNPISDTTARDICSALSSAKAGCIIVKP